VVETPNVLIYQITLGSWAIVTDPSAFKTRE
jgi:hypothetical protein